MSEPNYEDWVGREMSAEDVLSFAPVQRLSATLDRLSADHELKPGAPLPPLWHWLFFMPTVAHRELGPDGHPARGGFVPPVALPRRMYAGGRITVRAPLIIGEPAKITSRIDSVVSKQGRSGSLVFVTVAHEIEQNGRKCVRDEHDIVYRELVPSGGGKPAAPAGSRPSIWRETVNADPVMLFRYSAVTFNGHRIHYDRSYATEVENYLGLIVHGPLIATLLLEAAEKRRGRQADYYSFRALSPLFDIEPFDLVGIDGDNRDVDELEARAPDGRVAMVSEAHFNAD